MGFLEPPCQDIYHFIGWGDGEYSIYWYHDARTSGERYANGHALERNIKSWSKIHESGDKIGFELDMINKVC